MSFGGTCAFCLYVTNVWRDVLQIFRLITRLLILLASTTKHLKEYCLSNQSFHFVLSKRLDSVSGFVIATDPIWCKPLFTITLRLNLLSKCFVYRHKQSKNALWNNVYVTCEGLVSSGCYTEEHFILMCGKITRLYRCQKTNDKTSAIFKILLLYAMLINNSDRVANN